MSALEDVIGKQNSVVSIETRVQLTVKEGPLSKRTARSSCGMQGEMPPSISGKGN